MNVTFQIQGGGEEFEARVEAKLLALAAELGSVSTVRGDRPNPAESLVTGSWTCEQAEEVLRKLNGRATALVRAVADGDGWVDGAQYRATHGETALHGPTAAFTKAIKRAVKAGILPEGTTNPLTSTYDGHSSWQKTGGYRMDRAVAATFRTAFARLDQQGIPRPRPAATTALSRLSELYSEAGNHPDAAVGLARDVLEQHTSELIALLREHDCASAADALERLST
ncbi:hypothetical protein [Streptomyces sp. NPDC059072]|uniref:hypothetical protein n=1 Tax=Streptomyces sp. NPDC059072 TaxID=3346715 RepID=UPI003692A0B0